jgi:hypothetical protein
MAAGGSYLTNMPSTQGRLKGSDIPSDRLFAAWRVFPYGVPGSTRIDPAFSEAVQIVPKIRYLVTLREPRRLLLDSVRWLVSSVFGLCASYLHADELRVARFQKEGCCLT